MHKIACPTDLTREQWQLLKPLLPPPAKLGRKRQVDMREVCNAILDLCSTAATLRQVFLMTTDN